ncbi:heterokaryon incompatibility protein-domain-containing protein [Xylariaceae sp. FL0804]|nr:heterokaryon incompatibility protein-domain-containing protein [Xylariaceae sp. FL0804]
MSQLSEASLLRRSQLFAKLVGEAGLLAIEKDMFQDQNIDKDELQKLVMQLGVFLGLSWDDLVRVIKLENGLTAADSRKLKPGQILEKLKAGISSAFTYLECKRPNQPLEVLWEEIEDMLQESIPMETMKELIDLLRYGNLALASPPSFRTDEPTRPTYSYAGLFDGHIRLLVLRPSKSPTARVRCDLCHEALEPGLPYEALSYVWGDATNVGSIALNSCKTPVTRNLEDALRALRDPRKPRILWVDAVCINQRDHQEKASQIRLMAKIYSLARQVVVWVGKETNTAAKSFTYLKYITSVIQTAERNPPPRGSKLRSAHGIPRHPRYQSFEERAIRQPRASEGTLESIWSQLHERSIDLYKGEMTPSSGARSSSYAARFDNDASHASLGHGRYRLDTRQDTFHELIELWSKKTDNHMFTPPTDVLEALVTFFQRPWWSRIWVFQEIALSNSAVVQCGGTKMPWDDFQQAVGAIRAVVIFEWSIRPSIDSPIQKKDRYRKLELLDLKMRSVTVMQKYRGKRQRKESISLKMLMYATGDFKATDRRDFVYGLLSLVNDDPQIFDYMSPDYTIDTGLLYRKVAKYHLDRDGDLEMLVRSAEVMNRVLRNGIVCTQSWIPDYRTGISLVPIDCCIVYQDADYHRHTLVTANGRGSVPAGRCEFNYNASLSTKFTSHLRYSDDLAFLTVDGILFDVVRATTRICFRSKSPEKCLEEWQHIILVHEGCRERCTCVYQPGCTLAEAFWRSVLANKWLDGKSPARLCPIAQTILDRDKMTRNADGKCVFQHSVPFPPQTPADEEWLRGQIVKLMAYPLASCRGRRLLQTNLGLIGLGPPATRAGDTVAILRGSTVPFVLRPVDDGSWRLVGDSYVHGIMEGEAVKALESTGRDIQSCFVDIEIH